MTMPMPSNPAPVILTEADWQRLSPRTRRYVDASFELLDAASGHLRNGDLRQASEMGWGAAAQIVKAVAENWNLYHQSHRDLRELVNALATPGGPADLEAGFYSAQNLHHNFYENDAAAFSVALAVGRVGHFVHEMLPWLRRQRPY